jgi:tetrahydromethanopterin S-methyltransferase subunit G
MKQAAAPTAPYELVSIDLQGRTWTLFGSFYAIKRIREQTGVDLRNPATYTEWNVDQLPVMLFELLQHEEGAPSLEEIERSFDFRTAEHVAQRIFECVGIDVHALLDVAAELAEGVEQGEDPLEVARRIEKRQRPKKPRQRKTRARRQTS